ncbi:MAG: cytochrome c [Saprospiraceae bacterium]
MKKIIVLLLPVAILLCSALSDDLEIKGDTPVWEVLKKLGEPMPNHTTNTSVKGYSVELGRTIIFDGVGQDAKGDKSKLQSKHFVCTSCHNMEKEDPDLAKHDPEARLNYVAEKGLPFLQGTTLYGAVNRSSFYNDDYEKKYGDLVKPARNNLREAIQLCAVECSQGRRLKTVELESVLGFLWTLELKMEDLNLAESDYAQIEKAANGNGDKMATATKVKEQYSKGSPAHFINPPSDRKRSTNLTGNPENGKKIYELGCLHCHGHERYSFFDLDDSKPSFGYLERHMGKYDERSVYQVVRYGAPPHPGKRAYMPQYPVERMSRQQMEDLRAYIVKRAE